MTRPLRFAWSCLAFALLAASLPAQGALVLQSDFGTRDGAVASMKGVALGVDAALRIIDLTHQIEPLPSIRGTSPSTFTRRPGQRGPSA